MLGSSTNEKLRKKLEVHMVIAKKVKELNKENWDKKMIDITWRDTSLQVTAVPSWDKTENNRVDTQPRFHWDNLPKRC